MASGRNTTFESFDEFLEKGGKGAISELVYDVLAFMAAFNAATSTLNIHFGRDFPADTFPLKKPICDVDEAYLQVLEKLAISAERFGAPPYPRPTAVPSSSSSEPPRSSDNVPRD